MDGTDNSREFTRSRTRVRAEVRTEAGILIEGPTLDVSIRGLLVEVERPLPVGTPCSISLILEGGVEQTSVNVTGDVARTEERAMAIEFSGIDAEAFAHLRQLVLYNSPDADRTEEEMEAHIGLKNREE